MKAITIPILLCVLITLTACYMSDDDYRTMVVDNDVAGFSFEYRAFYRDTDGPYIVEESDYQFCHVDILAHTKERTMANPEPGSKDDPVAMSYVPAFISISVSNQILMNSKYSMTAIERIESSISSWSRQDNFKLLKRSKVVVSDIEAELIIYERDSIFSSWPLEYHIEISFDNEGLCWDIEATGRDLDMQEMIKQDVEHVISTFEILE